MKSHCVKYACRLIGLFLLLIANSSYADFIGRKGATLNVNGAVYNSFSISQTTTFTLYAAADYSASIIIFDTSDLDRFLNGGSVSYYDGFSGRFGITTITLSAGEYTLGARNRVNGPNTISYELEFWTPEISGAEYYDTYFNGVESLSAGSRHWHSFTVQSGFAYVVEGLNTGIDSYLIPESELSDFKAGRSFSYFEDYSSTNDPNQPGLHTINDLTPGTYYLAFHNSSSESHALVYAMYRYSDDSANSSGSGSGSGVGNASDVNIDGSVSYEIANGLVKIDVERVSNNGGASSGSLGLSLWATNSPYNGGSLSGYQLGSFQLGTLGAGYYYESFTLTDEFNSPPDGDYYISLILTEDVGGQSYIVDYSTFSSRKSFGVPDSGGSHSTSPSFDGQTLHIPQLLLADNSAYSVSFTYVNASNPATFLLTAATEISNISGNPATFDGQLLRIPSLVVGNVSYEIEMQLGPTDPVTFYLSRVK